MGRKRRQLTTAKDDGAAGGWNNIVLIVRLIKTFVIILLLMFLIIFLMNGELVTLDRNSLMLQNFLNTYWSRYQQITAGAELYCNETLNLRSLFDKMAEANILHQEQALLQLEQTMQSDRAFISIAIVGTPGVGKSLWAHTLAKYFPWQENVRFITWNLLTNKETEIISIVQTFADYFSDCGRNLVIIENLRHCDRYLVNLINDRLMSATGDYYSGNFKTIVVYVFSLNTFDNEEIVKRQRLELEQLPNIKTVSFRNFGDDELKDCIRREIQMLNVTVSEEAFKYILKSLNATLSGCKNVEKKVLMYSRV